MGKSVDVWSCTWFIYDLHTVFFIVGLLTCLPSVGIYLWSLNLGTFLMGFITSAWNFLTSNVAISKIVFQNINSVRGVGACFRGLWDYVNWLGLLLHTVTFTPAFFGPSRHFLSPGKRRDGDPREVGGRRAARRGPVEGDRRRRPSHRPSLQPLEPNIGLQILSFCRRSQYECFQNYINRGKHISA